MSSTTTTPPGTVRVPAEAFIALAVLGILAVLLLPLPPALLDGLLALNIAISVLMLLIALGLRQSLEFSVFPSVLLITTLFRLALNVATTRLILLRGGEGPGAAGHVIEAFGRFAVGGSLIVGFVVFLILLVVNFTVITKGSGRVSEVAARFTLDALPGKQMAIDADLAAGVVNDKEARARRQALDAEVEFFGAMDGASKFVRGDAIAALIITAINIVGGLAAGLLRDHLGLGQAAETYTLLTVGDGLVSQMPALLVSTAAGILVTRAAGADLGTQVSGQMFGRSRVLEYTAAVLALLGLLPGLPALAFLPMAGITFALARRARTQAASPQTAAAAAAAAAKESSEPKAERLQDVLRLDTLELEVGYQLLPLIDVEKGGEVPGRVTALRRQVAQELGIVLPPVHLRDNLRLEPTEYRVNLRGVELGKGQLWLDRVMALDPTGKAPDLDGLAGKEPAFGLPAKWILLKDRAGAEAKGLTLVDPASVLTTHLSELVRRHAHELVGRQEVQELLGAVAKEAPKLVEDTVPTTVTLGELVRVVRGLLREGVSVRDMKTVLEAVADAAPRSKDTGFLVEMTRRRLARQLTSRLVDPRGVVRALMFDRATEDVLRQSLAAQDGEPAVAPDVEVARRLIKSMEHQAAKLSAANLPVVLMAPTDLRRPLFDFFSRFIGDLFVVSARELTPGTPVEAAASLQLLPGAPLGARGES
ncbi:MAG: flagellar biosynthesis protein FlhA [Myxococcaceae bacterium]|nr:flagellar biosynthesis protein FlhA [Myxococcaceae bacterium]